MTSTRTSLCISPQGACVLHAVYMHVYHVMLIFSLSLYHVPVEFCMHMCVLFLVSLELRIKDASSSPCIGLV